jgi:hypothetical protein
VEGKLTDDQFDPNASWRAALSAGNRFYTAGRIGIHRRSQFVIPRK